MKPMMYIFHVLFIAFICLPQISNGQSSDQPVVLTEEEYNNASEQERQKVLNAPGSYLIVKDGEKVDVWRGEEGRSKATDRKPGEEAVSDQPLTEAQLQGKELLNEGAELKSKEEGQAVSEEDTEEFLNNQREQQMERAKVEREKLIREREAELQQKPKELPREELNKLSPDERKEYEADPQDYIQRKR